MMVCLACLLFVCVRLCLSRSAYENSMRPSGLVAGLAGVETGTSAATLISDAYTKQATATREIPMAKPACDRAL